MSSAFKLAVVSTLVSLSQPVLAQTKVKVGKVKGKNMIIRMATQQDYRPGDILYLSKEPPSSSSSGMPMRTSGGPFRYSLGFDFSFSSLSTETDGGGSSDTTVMDADVRFGIVKDKMEFGGLFTYFSQDLGGVSLTTLGLGGFGEFNLSEGGSFVPAVGGSLVYVSYDAGAAATTGFRLEPYGRGKFFAGQDVAVTGQLGYRHEMLSSDGGGDVTISGFVLSAGLTWYIQ